MTSVDRPDVKQVIEEMRVGGLPPNKTDTLKGYPGHFRIKVNYSIRMIVRREGQRFFVLMIGPRENFYGDNLRRRLGDKEAASMTGSMIALVPPQHITDALSARGGEDQSNMHVTLFWWKQGQVDRDVLRMAVEEYVAVFPASLRGKISGFGQFENGNGDGQPSYVLYASVDIPFIDEVKKNMREILTGWGISINDEHGLQPHMTIKYGKERFTQIPLLSDEAMQPFIIEEITLALGESWLHYPIAERIVPESVLLHDKPEDEQNRVGPKDIGAKPPDGTEHTEPEVHQRDGDHVAKAHIESIAGLPLPAHLAPGAPDPVWAQEETRRDGKQEGGRSIGNSDIAAKAREALAKIGMKNFTPGEQAALINEGDGVTAANLDRLDLQGTHYESLESRMSAEEDEQVGIDLMWG